MRGSFVVILGLLCVPLVLDALSLDSAASKELENIIKKDNFMVSLKHIKPKKRSKGASETLFSVVFPGSEQKFALFLDRKTKRVVVETLEEGRKRRQHFTVDVLEEDTTIKSLILSINQRQPGAHATLYIDCTSYGMVATPKSLKDMFTNMDEPKLEVHHEKRYLLEVEGQRDIRTVLSRNDCPLELESKSLNQFDDESFLNNYLRDDPNVYDPGRGDIPSVSVLDENSLLKALNELIRSVNTLHRKVGEEHNSIEWIRRYMEECDICKRAPPTPLPTPKPWRPSCETNPPNCFSGVRCMDTEQGPRCGPCPSGYYGNGYDCRPVRRCREGSCFPGVVCEDHATGYRCGPCPSGYEGDGQQCKRTCRSRPCFTGVSCEDTSTGFRCGRCPQGYEGNGEECRRIPTPQPCSYQPCGPGCAPQWNAPRQ